MAVGGNVPGMSWAGGAADPAVGGARGAMPVCDPQMLPSFRRWAHGQRPAFNSRGELAVLTPGGSRGGVRSAAICCWLLAVACGALVAVVGLAKALTPTVETAVRFLGVPKAVVGVVIALLVLLPEGLAALRAARVDQLQTSLNLALGSALASIGLTIPAVAVVSIVLRQPLELGLGTKDEVLLALTLFVAVIALGTGRTTVLQGIVHLVIFAAFLFFAVLP